MHLIEESPAQTALDDARIRWECADLAWDSATWVVINDPKIGKPLNESGLVRSFTFDGARSRKMPTVTVLYELRVDITHIHDAQFKDAQYAQAGNA